MKKSKIYKVRPTEIVQELQKREEEKLNELLIMGFDKSEVDKMRFNHQHKLDYPSNPITTLISNVLSVLFSYSDRIHKDILYEIAKGILEIASQDIISSEIEGEATMENINKAIMEVVIKKMEILYYFYEDEVFPSLIFDLCCLLDLTAEDYGFVKDDNHEK
jgi:hypothetical protein